VEPTRAEPGFGYIRPGAPLSPDLPRSEGGACWTEGYAEKPPRVRAEELIFLGALWNAGIYVWRVRVLLDALLEHAKELRPGLAFLREGEHATFAQSIESVSIERGLLERCDRLVVLPGEFQWDDVGTWASLRRARELDDNGNGAFGRTHFHEASGNIVHAEASGVVLYGVSSLLVVSVDGLTFVTTVDKATDLRSLIESLPTEFRPRR
jgi:mannose-1-phosphate guanylyltransferase